VEFITKTQLAHLLKTEFVDSVHPWGWDLSLKHELERIGMPEITLPTDDILYKVRAISSREWTAKHLQQDVEYAQTIEEVKALVKDWGKAVVKAPWSSSGRGVRYVSAEEFKMNADYPSFDRWVGNIIYRQGGVTVEPYYNKVKDFGMEFEVRDGQVVYRGLSLFDTIKNAYSGNILCPEQNKMQMLSAYVSEQQLLAIRQHIIEVMQPVLKDCYSGPFGVDMMIYAKGDATVADADKNSQVADYGVDACVEVNLRRTMGHVALDLANCLQLVASGDDAKKKLSSIMRVEYDGNRYHLRVMPGHPSEDAPLH